MKGDNNVKIFSKSAFFEKKLKKVDKMAKKAPPAAPEGLDYI